MKAESLGEGEAHSRLITVLVAALGWLVLTDTSPSHQLPEDATTTSTW